MRKGGHRGDNQKIGGIGVYIDSGSRRTGRRPSSDERQAELGRRDDKTKHYVMSMSVSGPSGQLVSERYDSQGTNEGFSDTVELSGVKPGDKLSVELVCNIMGTATKEITIK